MSSILPPFEYFAFEANHLASPEKRTIVIPGAPMKLGRWHVHADDDESYENRNGNMYSLVFPYSRESEPMTLSELDLGSDDDKESFFQHEKSNESNWYDDLDSLLNDDPMSIDELSLDDLPPQNVTLVRGVTYDDYNDDPMSIDELMTDNEDDPICINLQYDFDNAL